MKNWKVQNYLNHFGEQSKHTKSIILSNFCSSYLAILLLPSRFLANCIISKIKLIKKYWQRSKKSVTCLNRSCSEWSTYYVLTHLQSDFNIFEMFHENLTIGESDCTLCNRNEEWKIFFRVFQGYNWPLCASLHQTSRLYLNPKYPNCKTYWP